MKKGVRAIRAISIAALSLLVAVPLALYILLSTPWAQDKLRTAATAELSALLGSNVEVGAVEIHPFNRIDVRCVSVADDTGHPCLEVERVSARFELYHFLRTQRIMFDYALVDRPTLRVCRASDGAPLNVAGILARLKGKDEKKESRFNLRVSTVALRDGRIYYDVLDVAPPDSGRFDAHHIAVSGLQIHAALRRISNEEIDIELDRLSFDERSGLRLQELSGRLCGDDDGISVKELRLALPNSRLALDASYTHSGRRWHAGTDTAAPSVVYLPDLAPFSPLLAESYIGADIEFAAGGDSTSASLDHLRLSTRDESLHVDAAVQAIDIGTAGEEVWLRSLDVRADAPRLCTHLRRFMPAKAKMLDRLALLGQSHVRLDGTLVERARARIAMHAATALGSLYMHGNATSADSFATARIKSDAELHDLSLGVVTRQPKLGKVSAMLTADGRLNRSGFDGSADLKQAQIQFNGRTCSGISASARIAPHSVGATLDIDDRAMQVNITAEAAFARHEPHTLRLEGDITNLDLNWLGLLDAYEGYTLNATIDTDLSGYSADDIEGRILLADINFRNDNGDGVAMNRLELNRDLHTRPAVVELMSDYVDGRIEGDLTPSGLASDVRRIAFALFPALAPDGYATAANEAECSNDFDFEVAVADAEQLSRFFRLPVQIIHPIEISGSMDCAAQLLQVSLDAPYLQQGDKIIDNTALFAQADGRAGSATVYATTHMPTKKGPMAAVLNVGASNNIVSTAIDWTIERAIPLNGALSFDTRLHLGDDRLMAADVFFKPGTINFGDDVWNILPSHIAWSDGIAAVNGFALEAGEQRVAINGTASASEEERLTVDIERLSLLPIFETLEINNALISGTATGTFEGRSLLSPAPFLTSEKLHVDSIGYNRCTLGRYADVRAAWNNERKSVDLDADIIGLDGLPSTIKGSITPASEELDLAFDVQHVPVAFMQPYMKAFASSVAGYASGKARLFGTFKYIDLTGDVFADSLALKIDFTNTEYFCTDSLHIDPGVINVGDVTIRDVNGHTARLDGVVRHKFFSEPSFDFRVRDARDFLCYNVNSKQSPDWYGTIYGNGGAHIHGAPGVVNIDVNMATAPGSTFTFVLNDMLDADEYSFITFRDRTPVEIVDSVVEVERIPAAVLEFQRRMAAQTQDTPSDYNMDFRVDVTPDARINLVMDPVGGDEIRAIGSGNMRLTYGSANNDLRMFGTYTLDRGSYNFTLQDIIIKDFTINEGSSISFHGDPYAAQLNIEAVYAVNANLSDLDESFLQDRDLNRTNVPVHALMKVTGDMRQPDIAFDLQFPTLTSDVYRKVRSIVSTEEMMNRQIIYLLALNRFYTPDYMSTTKGNELFSVASSTISSQLSSMLGKLSDNWTIAPNLRSDRGDFSDVEVDVALSSRLLNNRLLFNGNFGYRDKSLNNNQFIGDFDIEYLLNRRGTWRLKAYNRYNDQNYYLRSAATTQGVGIMFKHDFDSLSDWLRFFRRKPKPSPSEK